MMMIISRNAGQVVNQKIFNSKVPKGGDKNSIFLNSIPYLILALFKNLSLFAPFFFLYSFSIVSDNRIIGKTIPDIKRNENIIKLSFIIVFIGLQR